MVVVSSSTNEWPQSHHIDEKGILMASTRSRLLMEKVPPSTQEPSEQQQIQQGLKCPRCYSSNTKFCYYNNYSLSQPRHFCKACKRYWTRGGTLRNVPVGGGCRKKKRVKRQTSSLEGPNNTTSTSNNTTTTTSVSRANPNHKNPTSQPQMDKISSNPNHINPLLFGLPSSPSELNLPFLARFNPSSRVSSSSIDGYDLQPQLNALGLWFSSGLITSGAAAATTDHPNVFINPDKQIQEMGINPSNPLLSSYSSIFGSSSSTISSTSPTMATLLASSFNHQKFGVKDTSKDPLDQFQTLTTTLEGLQMDGNIESVNVLKIEPGQSRLDWSLPYQNQVEQIGFADPNSLYWSVNPSTVGSWQDPANMGSSVTSLI